MLPLKLVKASVKSRFWIQARIRLQVFAEIFMIEFYTGSSNLYSFPLLALISTDRVSQSHCGTGGSSYPEDTGSSSYPEDTEIFREMRSIILINIPII